MERNRLVALLTLVVLGVAAAAVLTHPAGTGAALQGATGFARSALDRMFGTGTKTVPGVTIGKRGQGAVSSVASAVTGAASSIAGSIVGSCTKPPNLETWHGVTLAAPAMRAFQRAQGAAKGGIAVVSSYRSCDDQRAACRNVCGDPGGCSSGCAAPGRSNHQRGLAVDVSNVSFSTRYLVAVGFCHPFPTTDSGHFAYRRCS